MLKIYRTKEVLDFLCFFYSAIKPINSLGTGKKSVLLIPKTEYLYPIKKRYLYSIFLKPALLYLYYCFTGIKNKFSEKIRVKK